MITLQVCACVFHQFEPHIMVCLSAGSVSVFSIAWRKVAFESPLLFVCGLLVTWLLSVSNALPWPLELGNPLITVILLSKIESGVPHWCTPGTVHERSVKELIWHWKDCWEVQKPSLSVLVEKMHAITIETCQVLIFMNTTRPQNRSCKSLQWFIARLGLPQSLYWVLGYSKSVVVPPTLHFCSLQLTRSCTSCEMRAQLNTVRVFYFFLEQPCPSCLSDSSLAYFYSYSLLRRLPFPYLHTERVPTKFSSSSSSSSSFSFSSSPSFLNKNNNDQQRVKNRQQYKK